MTCTWRVLTLFVRVRDVGLPQLSLTVSIRRTARRTSSSLIWAVVPSTCHSWPSTMASSRSFRPTATPILVSLSCCVWTSCVPCVVKSTGLSSSEIIQSVKHELRAPRWMIFWRVHCVSANILKPSDPLLENAHVHHLKVNGWSRRWLRSYGLSALDNFEP